MKEQLRVVVVALGLTQFVERRAPTAALIADGVRALGCCSWKRWAASLGCVILLVAVPIAAVVVDRDLVGYGAAFGLAILAWQVVLYAPTARYRARESGTEVPRIRWGLFGLLVVADLALIVLAFGVRPETDDVRQGLLLGAAVAALADVLGHLVTCLLCLTDGWPFYRRHPSPQNHISAAREALEGQAETT